MLGASHAVLLGCTPPVTLTYDTVVFAFDPDVVSYWKFENSGADEKGTRNASITGSPELDVETIVDLDANGECIAWPGSSGAFAEAAHHGAHKTAAGTIVVTFQHDGLAQKSTLIAADANAAAGGLSMEVQTDGSPRCFLRRQSDGVPVALTGQPGDVQPNEAYTLIFKWGPAGLSMALWNEDGLLVRRVTGPIGDGVSGTSPIRFGAWHTDTSHHDGPYGRVIWLKRRISDGEEVVLARARTIEHAAPPGQLTQLGAWPLSETSGTAFSDATGGNTAFLTVPPWAVATHEHNRPGIVVGSDHALEVSNGGPAIPMISAYKQAAISLVIYVEPRSQLRGMQHWNESAEGWGREFIAFCDDGSTPGSFAIERRVRRTSFDHLDPNTWEYRLDGYVRNSSGTAVRFSGGLNGIAGALLPIDAAKRIVLTQGPAGATLFLDGSQVANLATVTEGWSSLTEDIHLGSSSNTGHANDRSPVWARLDQVEIWKGQMALADAQALDDAEQSVLYRVPTDGPLINIAAHSGDIQSAVNAAASAGGYVYQASDNDTWYTQPASNKIEWVSGCKGCVGLKVKKADNEEIHSGVIFDVKVIGSHKFIGCKIDGNGRGQDWHPQRGQPGFAHTAYDLQQSHAIRVESRSSGQDINVLVDACEFYEGTGDACSAYNRAQFTVRSARFYGYFRGPLVMNSDADASIDAARCESFTESPFSPGIKIGGGLQDIEPFGGNTDANRSCKTYIKDMWAESDFDEAGRQRDNNHPGYARYTNIHMLGNGFDFRHDSSPSFEATPLDEDWLKYCTICFWHTGHTDGVVPSGNYPRSWIGCIGPGTSGEGMLIEGTIFVANGDRYAAWEYGILDPAVDKFFQIHYDTGNSGSEPSGRVITMRNVEWRVKNLPSGMGNKRAIWFPSGVSHRNIELDGVLIDAAYDALPFNMGGMTVRYRNVLHEGTGNTKPWTNAGTEVPL